MTYNRYPRTRSTWITISSILLVCIEFSCLRFCLIYAKGSVLVWVKCKSALELLWSGLAVVLVLKTKPLKSCRTRFLHVPIHWIVSSMFHDNAILILLSYYIRLNTEYFSQSLHMTILSITSLKRRSLRVRAVLCQSNSGSDLEQEHCNTFLRLNTEPLLKSRLAESHKTVMSVAHREGYGFVILHQLVLQSLLHCQKSVRTNWWGLYTLKIELYSAWTAVHYSPSFRHVVQTVASSALALRVF